MRAEQGGRSLSAEWRRILIVDDDAGICQSLQDLLEQERCRVDTAPSGIHALRYLQQQEFDLVLSDVVMPDMDGYQLYQAIRKRPPRLTGRAHDGFQLR